MVVEVEPTATLANEVAALPALAVTEDEAHAGGVGKAAEIPAVVSGVRRHLDTGPFCGAVCGVMIRPTVPVVDAWRPRPIGGRAETNCEVGHLGLLAGLWDEPGCAEFSVSFADVAVDREYSLGTQTRGLALVPGCYDQRINMFERDEANGPRKYLSAPVKEMAGNLCQ